MSSPIEQQEDREAERRRTWDRAEADRQARVGSGVLQAVRATFILGPWLVPMGHFIYMKHADQSSGNLSDAYGAAWHCTLIGVELIVALAVSGFALAISRTPARPKTSTGGNAPKKF